MEQEAQAQTEQQQPLLHFTLTAGDVNSLLAALGEAPLKNVLHAYMAIRGEAERQLAAMQAQPTENGTAE